MFLSFKLASFRHAPINGQFPLQETPAENHESCIIIWHWTFVFLDEYNRHDFLLVHFIEEIHVGPLHDPVTWYGINYVGMQIMQKNFQNKGKLGWTGKSSFVLEVPQPHLRPSII